MRYTYTAAIIALFFSLTSCGNDDKKSIADNAAPIVVKISNVQGSDQKPFVTASGKIEAVNSANLSTRMMGFVTNIHVNVGDKVKKGQLLMSINNADLQAKRAQVDAGITEATAAFNNAQKDYNRFKNLFASNSASQKEMDDMTANYDMTKARLEAANQMKNGVNAQFAYVNIRAPFNGVVTNKFIEVGDMANPGTPLIAMETPGDFEVTAMVPESEISKIKTGTTTSVIVKSLNKTINGKVTEVSSSAKNTGGQFLVKVVLEKTDIKILSGMFTTVQFPIEKETTTANVILIPTSALVERGQLSGVYTVSQSNTVLLRWLRLGRSFGDKIEVLSGLSAEESYILSAEGKLYNGVKIIVQ